MRCRNGDAIARDDVRRIQRDALRGLIVRAASIRREGDIDSPRRDGPRSGSRRHLVIGAEVLRRDADAVIIDVRRIVTLRIDRRGALGRAHREGCRRKIRAAEGERHGIARADVRDAERYAVRDLIIDHAARIVRQGERRARFIIRDELDGDRRTLDRPSEGRAVRDRVITAAIARNALVQADRRFIAARIRRGMRARAVRQSHIGSIRRIDFARGFLARRAVRAVESRRHALRRLVIGEGGYIIPSDRDRFRRDIPSAGGQARTRELIVHSRRRGDAYRGRIRANMERQTVRQAARRRREGILREDGVALDHAREGSRCAVSRRRIIGEIALRPRGQAERHFRDGEGFACRRKSVRGARRIARKDIRGVRARIHLNVIREEAAIIASVDRDVAVARDHIAVRRRHCRIGRRLRHGSRDRPIMTVILAREDRGRRGRAVRHRPSVVIHALAGDHHVLRGRSGGEVIVIDESAVRAIREATQREGDIARRIQGDEDVLGGRISADGARRGFGVSYGLIFADKLFVIEVLPARRAIESILRETRRSQGVGQCLASDKSVEVNDIALIDESARVHVRSRIRRAVEGRPSEVFGGLRDVERLDIADGDGTLIDRPRSRSARQGVVIIVSRAARGERNARHAVRRHHAVVQIDVRRREGMRAVIADREGTAAVARGAETERLVADDARDRERPALRRAVIGEAIRLRPRSHQGLLRDGPSRRRARKGIVRRQAGAIRKRRGDRHLIAARIRNGIGLRAVAEGKGAYADGIRARRGRREAEGLVTDDTRDRERPALRRAVIREAIVNAPRSRHRRLPDRPRTGLQAADRGSLGRILRQARNQDISGIEIDVSAVIRSFITAIAVIRVLRIAGEELVIGAIEDVRTRRILHVNGLIRQAIVIIAERGDFAIIGTRVQVRHRGRTRLIAVIRHRQTARIARDKIVKGRRSAALRRAVIGKARRIRPADLHGERLDLIGVTRTRQRAGHRITSRGAFLVLLLKVDVIETVVLRVVARDVLVIRTIGRKRIAVDLRPRLAAVRAAIDFDIHLRRSRRAGEGDVEAVPRSQGAAVIDQFAEHGGVGREAEPRAIYIERAEERRARRKFVDDAGRGDIGEIDLRMRVRGKGGAAELIIGSKRIADDARIPRRTDEGVVRKRGA